MHDFLEAVGAHEPGVSEVIGLQHVVERLAVPADGITDHRFHLTRNEHLYKLQACDLGWVHPGIPEGGVTY